MFVSLPCPLLRPEDRTSLLVSFLEGMVSCKPGWGLGILPQNSYWAMRVLLRVLCRMGRSVL